jgi:hypothetical protein
LLIGDIATNHPQRPMSASRHMSRHVASYQADTSACSRDGHAPNGVRPLDFPFALLQSAMTTVRMLPNASWARSYSTGRVTGQPPDTSCPYLQCIYSTVEMNKDICTGNGALLCRYLPGLQLTWHYHYIAVNGPANARLRQPFSAPAGGSDTSDMCNGAESSAVPPLPKNWES